MLRTTMAFLLGVAFDTLRRNSVSRKLGEIISIEEGCLGKNLHAIRTMYDYKGGDVNFIFEEKYQKWLRGNEIERIRKSVYSTINRENSPTPTNISTNTVLSREEDIEITTIKSQLEQDIKDNKHISTSSTSVPTKSNLIDELNENELNMSTRPDELVSPKQPPNLNNKASSSIHVTHGFAHIKPDIPTIRLNSYNVLPYLFLRQALQNFGYRFKFRLDVLTGIFTCCRVLL